MIFSTRGPVYIHGEVKGDFTNESVTASLLTIKQETLTYESYFDGFKSTVMEIDAIPHVRNIYYILENPELDFLSKETIPRPFDYYGISSNRNFMDKGLYLKRMGIYREGLEKINVKKLEYLDPMSAMCDEIKCYSFLEGNFLYADDDHFSVFGSGFIVDKFKDSFFPN